MTRRAHSCHDGTSTTIAIATVVVILGLLAVVIGLIVEAYG